MSNKRNGQTTTPLKPAFTRTETAPISEEARAQFLQASIDYQNTVNQIAADTLQAMGLSPADGWVVHVGAGVAMRSVPAARPQGGAVFNPTLARAKR